MSARLGYAPAVGQPFSPATRLYILWFATLVAGCSGGGGAAATEGTGGSGSGGTATSGACPVGTQGCPCAGGGVCVDALTCVDGTCIDPSCGDGVVQAGEECDAGAQNSNTGTCKIDCTAARCGDGFVGPGEGCDDGNDDDADGCTNDCALSTCGDGVVQGGEACDDGNDVDDDACTNACTLPVCGDGVVQAGETCDDGNASNADGCVQGCQMALCGDGFVWAGMEVCDDGNTSDDDLCRSDCTPAECGDGIVQPPAGEECDDGNEVNDDVTCTNACTTPVCGDEILQAGLGEVCDDGANGMIADGCTDGCLVAPVGIVLSEDPMDVTSPVYLGGSAWDNGAVWKPATNAAAQAIRGYFALYSEVTQNCGPNPLIDGSRAIASPPTLVDAGGVPGAVAGAATTFGTVGFLNGVDANPMVRLCPDDQWLVGIEVKAGVYVHSVRLRCAPLDIVEENGTYAVHTGAVTMLSSAGGSGGSVVGTMSCPADHVVGHLFTRYDTEEGCHITLGIICNRVKLLFP